MEYESTAWAVQAPEAKQYRKKLKTEILSLFAGYFPPQNVRYLFLFIQSNNSPFENQQPLWKKPSNPNQQTKPPPLLKKKKN